MVVRWPGKGKGKKELHQFDVPAGYRDSNRPILGEGEVVTSTYQVRDMLASDDDGQLFEAWDMLLERMVTIRISWRDEGVPPLLSYARAVNAIAHPCAADVFGMGAHHGSEFVVCERINGVLLGDYIAETYTAGGDISVDACIDMLTKIAEGLHAVHLANLWMGDLRPEAILLAPSRRVVFTKFAAGQNEREEPVEPECWAPEVIQGAMPADHTGFMAIDLYALGLVAARMLLGRDPYAGDNPKATRFNHVHQRPPVVSTIRADVPTELSDLIEELLAKQTHMRPRSAHAVVGQLRTIAERQSSSRRILRVLIADESTDRVRPLWSALRRAYSRTVVDASHSSADALTKLRRDKPDVFVVDLALPGDMNGFELCMTLGNDSITRECAVIAVADAVNPSDAALLESMGVRFVLTRDTLGETLGQLIRELASGTRDAGGRSPISG